MSCLNFNVRCVQNIPNLDKLMFTVGELRNYVILTAVQRLETTRCTAKDSISINKRNIAMRKEVACTQNTKRTHFKEFLLMDYDIIGFDLDGTLLRYNLNNMVPLEHELLKEFLVKEKNYPKELLNQKFQSDFLQKGLFIDSKKGNLLKLSENGTILKATHGTNFMSVKEIVQTYGESRKWDVAQEYLKDPLSAWNGPIAEKLRTLLDYFDIAASLVFAQAVDILDKPTLGKNTLTKNNYTVWTDVLSGLIKIYTRENFATGESAYFEALKMNPNKYLLKTDDRVLDVLKQLKASGKALYLLTGSNIDFANFTATYALGPKWYELFDYTVGFAKKPGFFFAQRQFLKISNLSEVVGSEIPLNELLIPNFYSQGNWQQLKESLCKHVLHKDTENVRSLYVGDNLIQDIYTPNAMASMDTVALSEELLEKDDNYDFKPIVQSTLWGSYFSDNGISTLWSAIIEKYSKLCVSHIDVLTQIPTGEKICCENKEGFSLNNHKFNKT